MGELKSRFFDFERFQKRLESLVDIGNLFADFNNVVPRQGETIERDNAASEIHTVDLVRTVPGNELYGQAGRNVGELVFESGYHYLDDDLEDYRQFENLGISFDREVGLGASFREVGISEIPKSRVDIKVTCYEESYEGRYTFDRTNTPGVFMGRFRRSGNFSNKMGLLLPDDSILRPEVLKAIYPPQTIFMG